jgi:hypothetical protein
LQCAWRDPVPQFVRLALLAVAVCLCPYIADAQSSYKQAVFLGDSLPDAGTYGFTHAAHADACSKPDQDHCEASTLAEPHADQTCFFAAGEHRTMHANELLADYVLHRIGEEPK